MVPQAQALGFAAYAAGSDVGLAPKRAELTRVDLARDMREVGEGFGRRIARERAAGILPLCASWRPDLLVCEEMDFGAMLVAERLGLPSATVLISATGRSCGPASSPDRWTRCAPSKACRPIPASRCPAAGSSSHRSRRACAIQPRRCRPRRTRLRLLSRGGADDAAPPWLSRLGGRPAVYLTLGTVYNVESGDLFRRALTGLRDLPVDLIVTVGPDIDPDEFGPQPAGVRIERFVPQAALLPHCDLVVSHGGSGSVLGALAHGLPMVLLPLGADQPLNAARCAALGAARVLDAAHGGAARDTGRCTRRA